MTSECGVCGVLGLDLAAQCSCKHPQRTPPLICRWRLRGEWCTSGDSGESDVQVEIEGWVMYNCTGTRGLYAAADVQHCLHRAASAGGTNRFQQGRRDRTAPSPAPPRAAAPPVPPGGSLRSRSCSGACGWRGRDGALPHPPLLQTAHGGSDMYPINNFFRKFFHISPFSPLF